jgi:Homing endonuclease associated repeat
MNSQDSPSTTSLTATNSNSFPTATARSTKEEIIAAIQACAAKLGHVPSQEELKRETGIHGKIFARHFGNYTKALRASGFEGRGAGFTLDMGELFQEWAGIVRKIGEVPSAAEYILHSQHSLTPLRKRFRYWNDVPAGMVQYAVENGLEEQWADVLEVARKYRREGRTGGWRRKPGVLSSNPRILNDRPVYGAPFLRTALSFAPVNEMGVVFLFGAMAEKLGFIVTWIGTAYPDVEAFREVAPGRWQRVRVEVEFQSRNFLQHFHDPKECDLIVCWENNWPDCPLEVVELKKALEISGNRRDQKTENFTADLRG